MPTMVAHTMVCGRTSEVLASWPFARTVLSQTGMAFVRSRVIPIELACCYDNSSTINDRSTANVEKCETFKLYRERPRN